MYRGELSDVIDSILSYVNMSGLCLRLRVPNEMCVAILSIGSVTLCVLVNMMRKPIEIFFTSLCSAMSFICGSKIGDDVHGNSCTYAEGRPIGGLIRFGPSYLFDTSKWCRISIFSFFDLVKPRFVKLYH